MIHDFTMNLGRRGRQKEAVADGIDALSCLQTRFEKSLHSAQFMIVFFFLILRNVRCSLKRQKSNNNSFIF